MLVILVSLISEVKSKKMQPYVSLAFGLVWLLVLIFSLTLPWMIGPLPGGPIGTQGPYCVWYGGNSLFPFGLIVGEALFGVLALVTIFTIALSRNRIALVAVVVMKLACVVSECIVAAKTKDTAYRIVVPSIMQAITTSMACKVYRRIHHQTKPASATLVANDAEKTGRMDEEEQRPAIEASQRTYPPKSQAFQLHRPNEHEIAEREEEHHSLDTTDEYDILRRSRSSVTMVPVTDTREDLIKPPRHSRLYMDSRAAAAAEQRSHDRTCRATQTFAHNIPSSSSVDTVSTRSALKFVNSLPSKTASTTMSSLDVNSSEVWSRHPPTASRRSILSHAEERLVSAGLVKPSSSPHATKKSAMQNVLLDDPCSPSSRPTTAVSSSQSSTLKSPRSYLASPALYDNSPDPRSQSRAALDVDDVMKRANFSALRAAAAKLDRLSPRTANHLELGDRPTREALDHESGAFSRPSMSLPGSPTTKNSSDRPTAHSRPRSSPENAELSSGYETPAPVPALPSSASTRGFEPTDCHDESVGDALLAFRQTVEEDCHIRKEVSTGSVNAEVKTHDGLPDNSTERPRTARGAGQDDARPGTRNGSSGGVGSGTFGALQRQKSFLARRPPPDHEVRRRPATSDSITHSASSEGHDLSQEGEAIEIAIGSSPVRRESYGNISQQTRLRQQTLSGRRRSSSAPRPLL